MEPTSDSSNPTAELIARQRRILCITQRQLAETVGVTQSAVAKWESGAAEVALRNRRALAAALSIHPATLFPEPAVGSAA